MNVSDRDRKILWARSGNRCAKCRRELVPPSGHPAVDAVVGEECHIVSPRMGGPRGTTTPHPDRNLDAYGNLILLCPSDHSLVDQLVA